MNSDYRVTLVTDYLTITTNVELYLDEYTGNLSPEAYKQAVIEADAMVEYEFGRKISERANDVIVTLILSDEEIDLEGGE